MKVKFSVGTRKPNEHNSRVKYKYKSSSREFTREPREKDNLNVDFSGQNLTDVGTVKDKVEDQDIKNIFVEEIGRNNIIDKIYF